MISIFICDDNVSFLDLIEKQVSKTIMMHDLDMMITKVTPSANEIVADVESSKGMNIYFLDVDLQDEKYNGFELAKKIRTFDPRGYIIFITTHEELLVETFRYRVEAMDYIIKDSLDLKKRIESCLLNIQELLDVKQNNNASYYSINYNGVIHNLNIDDIIFFETSYNKHKIIVHATNLVLEFSGNLTKIEDDLEDKFIRIHRSFLINRDKIERIEKNSNSIKLMDGTICPFSRKAKKHLV